MGPRPRGRGISSEYPDIVFRVVWLQWGRDRAVAELESFGAWCARASRLQWGRDRAVAELRHYQELMLLYLTLQWGRDRAVAEFLHLI